MLGRSNRTLAVGKMFFYVLSAIGLLGCAASAHGPGGQPAWETSQQLAIFEAALDHEVGQQTERVDPRPIKVHHDSIFPDSSHLVIVDSSTLAARTNLIENRSTEAGKVFPLRDDCSGFLVPPHHKETQGCPDAPEIQLVFGLAHRGGAGGWLLPMIEVQYSPRGRGITTYDLILERQQDEWRVVRKIGRIAWD